MNNPKDRSVSRRDFLKLTAAGVAAAGAGSVLAACGAQPTPAPTKAPAATQAATAAPTAAPKAGETLKCWWWGEQEAPGVENWINETVAMFKEETGHTIETTLQDTGVVISEFQTASAANSAPDIQFVWNGVYQMEAAWLGYFEPLDGLIDAKMLEDASPTCMNQYEGKTYSTSWYSCGIACAYNKEMFDKAGLDPEKAPETFEELMDTCDKLKSLDVIPMSAGMKDTFWSEWYHGHALSPNLDTPADALKLYAGEGLDWRDPRYYDVWTKLGEMWNAGNINDDMLSIDLYPAIDLFGTGKAAMTWLVVPLLKAQKDMLGGEIMGVFPYPMSGQGKLNNWPVLDTNGWGISSQSEKKDIAVEFLKFMQRPERITAVWDSSKALPTTKSWPGGEVIEDPWWLDVWEKYIHGPTAQYVPDMMPALFWSDANLVNAQKTITGELSPEECGENAYQVVQKWREQSPDMLEKYTLWAESMEKVWNEKYV